jgi:RND family efflux transporter MFP subunit
LQSALSQEKQAEDQVSYTLLQADSDGVIMDVPSDPGQVVAAGQTVVRLAHDGPREAEVYLPEGNEQMAVDDARAALYAKPGETAPAKLRELSAMADPATRTYRARYVLGGAGQQAPLGATVTLTLSRTVNDGKRFDIPVGALFDAGHGPSVWIIDPASSTVTARPVAVAQMGEERATVTSGLFAGERIIALGAHLLNTGDKVEVAATLLDTTAR